MFIDQEYRGRRYGTEGIGLPQPQKPKRSRKIHLRVSGGWSRLATTTSLKWWGGIGGVALGGTTGNKKMGGFFVSYTLWKGREIRDWT